MCNEKLYGNGLSNAANVDDLHMREESMQIFILAIYFAGYLNQVNILLPA